MIINEQKLRNIIKNILKEDFNKFKNLNENDPNDPYFKLVPFDNKTTFDISIPLEKPNKKLDKISDIILLLTQTKNEFQKISKTVKKMKYDNLPLLLAAASCGICKQTWHKRKNDFLYIQIEGLSDEKTSITISWDLYQKLYQPFRDIILKEFPSTNPDYPSSYSSNANFASAFSYNQQKTEKEFDGEMIVDDWKSFVEIFSNLRSSHLFYEKRNEIGIGGFPVCYNSYNDLMKGFDIAINNFKKLEQKLEPVKKPDITLIKKNISNVLNQIFLDNRINKDKTKFFEMLKRLSAQYSENNNIENIIEIFEKVLNKKNYKESDDYTQSFYNINSFIFQHRSKEEKKDWIKFISWLQKRYKKM